VANILAKVESGTDLQTIKPKTWTYVRFDRKTKFTPDAAGEWEWIVVLRVKYPSLGAPKVLRGRFVRYPGTSKADETGHDDKNTGGWGGRDLHSHWSHTFTGAPTMPVGFWVWHDGARSITLDGRQIKAKRVG
jgi:hypothetical protein